MRGMRVTVELIFRLRMNTGTLTAVNEGSIRPGTANRSTRTPNTAATSAISNDRVSDAVVGLLQEWPDGLPSVL